MNTLNFKFNRKTIRKKLTRPLAIALAFVLLLASGPVFANGMSSMDNATGVPIQLNRGICDTCDTSPLLNSQFEGKVGFEGVFLTPIKRQP